MDSADKIALIREMRPEDSDGIARIYSEITKKPVEADFDKLIHAHATGKDSACFVAELDGKVIGFMISYILTLGFGIDKSGWIATLGVDPRHMGGGVGARLAEESFKFYKAQGITRVYTSVRWDSTDLLSFFMTLNFERSDFINLTKTLG
ncbi:MAG: GNAT family N-acetyltransferase [Deltaproteobacteria bacterium]|jgi:ribosomal protein S18 acetylase RimI-like enzyme|nr:GNAT family N-acetyltransferase [Deltaproteobacteria bacterium]